MQDPHQELRDYLDTLAHKVIYLKSILGQVNILNEWRRSEDYKTLDTGSHFFTSYLYSTDRNLTIELCNLLNKDEDRNIFDWLDKADEHVKSLKPEREINFNGDSELVPIKEYRSIISQHKKDMSTHSDIIDNLINRRHKGFAHADSTYFKNPNKLAVDFPISWKDYDILLNCLAEIIQKHYGYLFSVHLDFKLVHSSGIRSILVSIRAIERIKDHPDMKDFRIKLLSFFRDDYGAEEA